MWLTYFIGSNLQRTWWQCKGSTLTISSWSRNNTTNIQRERSDCSCCKINEKQTTNFGRKRTEFNRSTQGITRRSRKFIENAQWRQLTTRSYRYTENFAGVEMAQLLVGSAKKKLDVLKKQLGDNSNQMNQLRKKLKKWTKKWYKKKIKFVSL